MSDALKSNKTLIELNLRSKDKRNKKNTHRHRLFPILIKSTENMIRNRGVESLCDALKMNATLAKLNLRCEDKKRNNI